MGKDNKDSEKEAQEQQKSRQELRERIQTLEWSLAQKNRENKKLQAEVDAHKAENTAQNDDDESKSG